MSALFAILVVFIGCFFISFVVFGGAQIFIPYFKILLVDMLKISSETWESVLAISNLTPGVFGIKLAFISGFLASNGEWWGYILMFLTYSVFIFVPVLIIVFVMKKYNKIKNSPFMKIFLQIMKSIVAGILVSLIVTLFMSLSLPFIKFNELGDKFGQLDKYFYFKKDVFFIEWRYWVLLSWSIVSVPSNFVVICKTKINTFILITINILICLLLFQPWL